ncbi:hypothetical protein ACN38_g319 [Penicillium nordicum]|uniref:Uncharacterized protein n=1 Tax=Penicillium nordicum TaxID=229535 RepID=A0A0M8PAU2_9EURO|nr:hypothetical protein ACN38_g319 [Penicillium nordicum]
MLIYRQDGAISLPKDRVHLVFYNRCDQKDIDRAVGLLGTFPVGPLTVPVTYTAYQLLSNIPGPGKCAIFGLFWFDITILLSVELHFDFVASHFRLN